MVTNSQARRNARRALLQGLVQVTLIETNLFDTKAWLNRENLLQDVDIEYFTSCFEGFCNSYEELDPVYEPYLDRTVEELGLVERTVLRLGTYELLEREDVPFRVVINEWVDLTKDFGAEDSFKFVNGVLDQVARSVRSEVP